MGLPGLGFCGKIPRLVLGAKSRSEARVGSTGAVGWGMDVIVPEGELSRPKWPTWAVMSSLLVEVGGQKPGYRFEVIVEGILMEGWTRGPRHADSVTFLLRPTPCLCPAQDVAPSRYGLGIIIE